MVPRVRAAKPRHKEHLAVTMTHAHVLGHTQRRCIRGVHVLATQQQLQRCRVQGHARAWGMRMPGYDYAGLMGFVVLFFSEGEARGQGPGARGPGDQGGSTASVLLCTAVFF